MQDPAQTSGVARKLLYPLAFEGDVERDGVTALFHDRLSTKAALEASHGRSVLLPPNESRMSCGAKPAGARSAQPAPQTRGRTKQRFP